MAISCDGTLLLVSVLRQVFVQHLRLAGGAVEVFLLRTVEGGKAGKAAQRGKLQYRQVLVFVAFLQYVKLLYA